MSQPVTISTPTTTTSNGIRLHYDYLRTIPGILKIGELILGAVTVGCVGSSYDFDSAGLFFLLMATTFMMCSFCLVLSSLITWRNSKHISETMFELIYHVVATFFMLAASITIAVTYTTPYQEQIYTAASVIGSMNSVMYCLSAIFAYNGLVNVQPERGYYNSNSIRDFSSTPKTDSQDYIRY